jgi:hypothetical protein
MEFNVGIGGRVPGELACGNRHLLLIPWRLFKTLCASCGKFAADIPNYSNVVGELQISDIV